MLRHWRFLLFGILFLNIVGAQGASEDWELSFTCSLEQYSQTLTIGFNQDASTGFDRTLDAVMPPQPPVGVYAYLEHPENEVFLRKLSKSVVGDESSYEWKIRIRPIGTGGLLTFEWGQLPPGIEITVSEGVNVYFLSELDKLVFQVNNNDETQLWVTAERRDAEEVSIIEEDPPESNLDPNPYEINGTLDIDSDQIIEDIDIISGENITGSNTQETNNTVDSIIDEIIKDSGDENIESNSSETNNTLISEPDSNTDDPGEGTDVEIHISSILVSPQQISSGEETILTVVIYNPSSQAQEYNVEVRLDGVFIYSARGTLDALMNKELTKEIQVETPGTHWISVNDQWVSVEVKSALGIGVEPWMPLLGVLLYLLMKKIK